VAGSLKTKWPIYYLKYRPKQKKNLDDQLFRYCSNKILADVLFRHRPKQMYGRWGDQRCPKVINSVFGQYNCTKNRGACVEDIIWLLVFYGPN
jgi:hypothetical protein